MTLDLKATRANWLEWDSGTVVTLLDALAESRLALGLKQQQLALREHEAADLRAQLEAAQAAIETADSEADRGMDAASRLGYERGLATGRALMAAPLPPGLVVLTVEEREQLKKMIKQGWGHQVSAAMGSCFETSTGCICGKSAALALLEGKKP